MTYSLISKSCYLPTEDTNLYIYDNGSVSHLSASVFTAVAARAICQALGLHVYGSSSVSYLSGSWPPCLQH